MGCDAHVHVEIKIKGQWHHYTQFQPERNYELFALMADVRNDGEIEPISKPKGLPQDIAFVTRFDRDHDGEDGHSDSWLSAEELVLLEDRYEQMAKAHGWRLMSLEHDVYGRQYFFGNAFADWIRYPEDMRRLRDAGMEDVRFVFWFDN